MLLISNGYLITRDGKFFERGAVAADGAKIVAVGESDALCEQYKNAERIDARGGVIMPAFINAHEHIYSAPARGFSPKGYSPSGFLDILEGMWWNLDRKLNNERTKISAEVTLLECVKNGVTTVFDHHASYGEITDSLFAIESAAKEFGVRICLCYEVSDRDGEEKARAAIAENAAWLRHCKTDPSMLAGAMGLHARFTLSDKTLELAARDAENRYHIHAAEGIDDLEFCLKHYGKRVIPSLRKILGEHTLLAHCVHIDDGEIDLIKETNSIVTHNPESNMGNACGCPPTMEIVRRGILTGLGTDGYTHDMLESYKAANLLHKHHLRDPNAAWTEVPQMLFGGNAEIAGRFFDTRVGVLKPGAAADIIVLAYKPPTPMGEGNINGHLLFGATGRDVVTTVCNGKVLMKDREIIGIDEEKILADARSEAKKLWEEF